MQTNFDNQLLALSCSSWSFASVPLIQSLQIVSTLGFTRVDVGFEHLAEDPFESPIQRADRMNRFLCDTRLELSDLFPDLPFEANDPHPDHQDSNRAAFADMIVTAKKLHAPGITLRPGLPHPEDIALGRRLSVVAFREFFSVASDAGVRLSVEPHIGSILQRPDDAMWFLSEVPGLMLTLDYSHFVAIGVPLEKITPLHAYTAHFHLRQARPGRVQCRAQEGTIPVRKVVQELVACGYTGVVSLEYQNTEWQGCNDIDVIAETIATVHEIGGTSSETCCDLPVRKKKEE